MCLNIKMFYFQIGLALRKTQIYMSQIVVENVCPVRYKQMPDGTFKLTSVANSALKM